MNWWTVVEEFKTKTSLEMGTAHSAFGKEGLTSRARPRVTASSKCGLVLVLPPGADALNLVLSAIAVSLITPVTLRGGRNILIATA